MVFLIVGPFLITLLILSTTISTLSKSWLMVWIVIEINTTAIAIVLINEWSNENTIVFFIIQSLPSMAILLSVVLNWNPFQEINNPNLMFIVALSIICNIGIFPAHAWILNISNLISWSNNLLIITWQNFLPLIILMNLFLSNNIIALVITSIIMITLAILNSTSINTLLIASSIAHITWIIISTSNISAVCLVYLCVYSLLLSLVVLFINNWNTFMVITQEASVVQDQIGLNISIISISGIPPITGFFLNVIVICLLLNYSNPSKLSITLLIATAGAFYAYNQTTINLIILNPSENNEKNKINMINENIPILLNLILPLSFFI